MRHKTAVIQWHQIPFNKASIFLLVVMFREDEEMVGG